MNHEPSRPLPTPNKNREAGLFQLPRDFRQLSGGSDETRTRDLRHCWKANAIRSRLDKDIRDAVVGHGNKKKSLSSVYLSISDEDLVKEIGRLTLIAGRQRFGDKNDQQRFFLAMRLTPHSAELPC